MKVWTFTVAAFGVLALLHGPSSVSADHAGATLDQVIHGELGTALDRGRGPRPGPDPGPDPEKILSIRDRKSAMPAGWTRPPTENYFF